MNYPLVSVLLPIGKDKRYLKEAVESINRQSYKNIELLEAEDKGFGITRTLIKLAEGARGEYLARVDADDICEPCRIKKQVEFLQSNPEVMLVGSWATLIDESGHEIGVQKMPVSWEEIKKQAFHRNPLIHPSWIMRKEWFDKIGGYNLEFKYSQDWELILRRVWSDRIENIPEALLKLRIHRQSSSFNKNKEQICWGLKARLGAIRLGYVPSGRIIHLIPSLFSLIIPSGLKYRYRKVIQIINDR